MKTRWIFVVSVVLALAVLVAGLILEPRFPQVMATHWDENGNVNGYGSRFVGIWLIPLMVIALSGLFALLPKIDPLKENLAKFKTEYNGFVLFFAVFMVYMQVLTMILNLGYEINLITYMVPMFGALIYYSGVLMSKAQRNYFVGIRTPWTLQDDEVWKLTHQRGALLFKLSGLIAFLSIFLPVGGFYLLIVPILLSSAYIVVYSYVVYQRLHPHI